VRLKYQVSVRLNCVLDSLIQNLTRTEPIEPMLKYGPRHVGQEALHLLDEDRLDAGRAHRLDVLEPEHARLGQPAGVLRHIEEMVASHSSHLAAVVQLV